jgi:3-deoxy-D-manno-octulosonate 8-phosphate phosphatase (KDO 8-P phosphatase)
MEDSLVERRASRIKLLLMDCDGVLTDGSIWLVEDGEQKAFNVKDGLGIDLLHKAGLKSGVISGRTSQTLAQRAGELGMAFVRQGEPDKIAAFQEILTAAGVESNEVAYIGDDLNDIPLMRRSEFAVAVADAVEEARSVAHYVTEARGGEGAVREVIEIILRAQGRWSDIVKRYLR